MREQFTYNPERQTVAVIIIAVFQSRVRSSRSSQSSIPHSSVLNDDLGRGDRRGGEHITVLLDVDECRARRALGAGAGGCHGVGERDGAKVGERDKPPILLIVLDDPLGVLLAEGVGGGEALCHGLASRDVLDDGRAASRARRGDSRLDRVASADADPGEVISVVRVPFVPGYRNAR